MNTHRGLVTRKFAVRCGVVVRFACRAVTVVTVNYRADTKQRVSDVHIYYIDIVTKLIYFGFPTRLRAKVASVARIERRGNEESIRRAFRIANTR